MARPIKETPILYGEDARRFEARMKEKRTETQEEKAERIRIYEMLKATANFWITGTYADAIPFYLKNSFVPLNEVDKGDETRLLYFDLNDVG